MRLATRLASGKQAGGLLTVLVFHKVLEEKNAFYPDIPDRSEFAQILEWITEQFNVVRLSDAVDGLHAGQLPVRAAAITFDDGNGDTLSCSAPLFDQKKIPATFFVNTAYLEGGEPFFERIFKALEQSSRESLNLTHMGEGLVPLRAPHQRRTLADRLCEKAKYMSPTDAEAFANTIVDICQVDASVRMVSTQELTQKRCNWIDFGGHSHHHSILTTLDSITAKREILACKGIISDLTGNSEPLFAFPNGKPGTDFTAEHEAMVRQVGFKAAFACSPGAMTQASNRFSVPRFTAWDKSRLRFQARMLMNLIST
jgi:peptidoglycan/xylan/chitin deacetylase (PgdA/CDA1 family)